MASKIIVNKYYGKENFDEIMRYIIRVKLSNYNIEEEKEEKCYNVNNIKAANYQTKEKIR